jgi:hypothetical protein
MNRKFTLMLIEDGSDLLQPLNDLVLLKHFTPYDGFDLNAFKRDLEAMAEDVLPDNRVTSSKIVVVLDLNAEVNARFLEDVAEKAPTNGFYAQRVEVGQEFPSARAASSHLGLNHNEVAIYLNKAKHRPPAERIAKLRGVTVAYREDYHAALLGNLRD